MNKSQQIYFTTGNTMYAKVRLEQDVDTFEFMSMKLNTEDVYQDFNSDYGVLVGKVTANGGVGIPNVKISIFIPLTDEDATDGQITSIYPYKTPRDKNLEGKRYNLLPRVSKLDPNTNQLIPKQAFGSFPIKEEIVTNVLLMDVYKKYYKYTALTNVAGDYMIFGVPVGTQTVHMSVDITDIGEFSMNPASMVTNLGYSPNLFTNYNSKIKSSSDLGDLPNIETQEISVDVIPFWGDTSNFEIGITRQDFRIRAALVNTFTIFGSAFTDSADTLWGENQYTGKKMAELYRAKNPSEAYIGMATKRNANVTEKIYYYPSNVSDIDIDSGNVDPNGADMLILDPSEYSSYKRNGDFVFIISANRNKVTTNEMGVRIPISDDSPDGVFTKFRGFVTFEITTDDAQITATGQLDSNAGKDAKLVGYRYKLKFPQYAKSDYGFSIPDWSNTHQVLGEDLNKVWRKQNYTFDAGKLYSISRFHGTTKNNSTNDQGMNSFGFIEDDAINNATEDPNCNVGIIVTGDWNGYDNSSQKFPSNAVRDGLEMFGANWMNFALYLQQSGYLISEYSNSNIRNNRTADNFSRQYSNEQTTYGSDYFLKTIGNDMKIAAGDFNTVGFARSDLHWTDFVEVDVKDLVFLAQQEKGYKYNPDNYSPNEKPITGKYRSGRLDSVPTTGGWTAPCPLVEGEDLSKGGVLGGAPIVPQPANPPTGVYPPDNPQDPNIYFYRGAGDADCIKFLMDLGLIN